MESAQERLAALYTLAKCHLCNASKTSTTSGKRKRRRTTLLETGTAPGVEGEPRDENIGTVSGLFALLKPEISLLSTYLGDRKDGDAATSCLTKVEVSRMEDGLASIRDSVLKYWEKRGDLLVKYVQNPKIQEYRIALQELDEIQYAYLVASIRDICQSWQFIEARIQS